MDINTIPLWHTDVPSALGQKPEDQPSLTIVRPPPGETKKASFVICPGGGYGRLAEHEGMGYAQWLAGHGVTSFVLKSRLGSHGYRHPVMLGDVQRAMRLARHLAPNFGLDAGRIGIIGSSAGGHLAAMALTNFDGGNSGADDAVEGVSCRPDLGILCYPVITMASEHTHEGSRRNLLGDDPTEGLKKECSPELLVTRETPPCFIWHTDEDPAVPVENALVFAAALRANRVPFELHVYEKGRHGLGLGDSTENPHLWTGACLAWLGERGWLNS